ncbi:serotriflin-like [Rhinophrynus dorsalis]
MRIVTRVLGKPVPATPNVCLLSIFPDEIEDANDKSLLCELLQDTATFESLSCELETVRQFIVDRHNELRANVKPSPGNMLKMSWSEKAAENAAKVALKCANAHSRPEERELVEFGCGENLYMASRPHSWRKGIQGWYDEVYDFVFGKGPKSKNAVIGHYTQLVWYKSYLLGCAVAYCPQQTLPYYYVCHYCPSGNAGDSINNPYAVGDACANCTHACVNGLCTNPCKENDDIGNCHEFLDYCEDEYFTMVADMCKASCSCKTEII